MIFADLTYISLRYCPGWAPSLLCSRVVSLAISGQWEYFPGVPGHVAFNRPGGRHHNAIEASRLHLMQTVQVQVGFREDLESTAVVKRCGKEWSPGQANSGRRKWIDWCEGSHLLLCMSYKEAIVSFGPQATNSHSHQLAATLFTVLQSSPPLSSLGLAAQGFSVVDKEVVGMHPGYRWQQQRWIDLRTSPHQSGKNIRRPKPLHP